MTYAAPKFSAFRPRVRVKLNEHLTLVCYAPNVDDGLKAERLIEAADELQAKYDAARDEAIAEDMRAQLWSLLVGVEITDEAGDVAQPPKDWRGEIEREGTLDGRFGAQAWGLLFQRQLAARIVRSRTRREGDSRGPKAAGRGHAGRAAHVPVGKGSVSGKRVRAVS